MQYLILGLIILVLGGIILYFAGLLAFFILAIAFGLSVVFAGVTVLAGLMTGTLTPIRVFLGKKPLVESPVIAEPKYVHEGQVIPGNPPSPCEAFPWDKAWPNYFPYQHGNDVNAVAANMRKHDHTALAWGSRLVARLTPSQIILRIFMFIVLFLVITIPLWSYVLGRKISYLLFRIVSWSEGFLLSIGQNIMALHVRREEEKSLKQNHAGLHCIYCYRDSTVPSFKCSNLNCNIIHRDIRPGKLGLWKRYCECGTQLPVGVVEASKKLVPICPFCNQEQSAGSGARKVIRIPVFGAVSSGKTQFLSSAIVKVQERASANGAMFEAQTPNALNFMNNAAEEIRADLRPQKTPKRERLESLQYVWSSGSDDIEIQLIDSAGENFTDNEESRTLSYFDTANTLIFIFDPLQLASMQDKLAVSSLDRSEIQIAQGRADTAYGALVDRLRNDGIAIQSKILAFVVSKADIVNQISPDDQIPTESSGVREWLINNDADALIRRIELDFSNVQFFAICSYQAQKQNPNLHPINVVNWVAEQHSAGHLA